MEFNHKELSMILAGLMRLSEDPQWFLDIMLVDIQEQMKADDLRRLIDRMVDEDMKTVEEWSPGTKDLADKLMSDDPPALKELTEALIKLKGQI